MPTMRDILKHCSVSELRACASCCLLPETGTKSELISRLVQAYSPSKGSEILHALGSNDLKRVCLGYGLPVSGTKATLIERVFSIVTVSARTDTAKKKCQMCEHLFDRRLIHEHHFVPKAVSTTRWGYIGGVILLCGSCHTLFHRRQVEEQAKKGSILDEAQIRRLFNRTKREMRAGTYGRK